MSIKEDDICTQYSGVDKEGKNVMGILKYKSKNKRFEIDNILKWYLNSEWTLKEAAELPLVYIMVKKYLCLFLLKFSFHIKMLQAYYCLVGKACVKSGNSILIHDGCSQNGQAFLRVALEFNCTIYVTTYSKDQSDFLKSLFPKVINNSRIMLMQFFDLIS